MRKQWGRRKALHLPSLSEAAYASSRFTHTPDQGNPPKKLWKQGHSLDVAHHGESSWKFLQYSMVIFQSATTRASCVVMSACVHQIYTLLISIARSYLDMTWLGAGGMGRRRYIPSCISALIFAALCLSVTHGQTTDNSTTSTADSSSVVVTDSCVAESCGISSW